MKSFLKILAIGAIPALKPDSLLVTSSDPTIEQLNKQSSELESEAAQTADFTSNAIDELKTNVDSIENKLKNAVNLNQKLEQMVEETKNDMEAAESVAVEAKRLSKEASNEAYQGAKEAVTAEIKLIKEGMEKDYNAEIAKYEEKKMKLTDAVEVGTGSVIADSDDSKAKSARVQAINNAIAKGKSTADAYAERASQTMMESWQMGQLAKKQAGTATSGSSADGGKEYEKATKTLRKATDLASQAERYNAVYEASTNAIPAYQEELQNAIKAASFMQKESTRSVGLENNGQKVLGF